MQLFIYEIYLTHNLREDQQNELRNSNQKSFNVYKTQPRGNNINRLRGSNSFYQVSKERHSIENLYKKSQINNQEKNKNFSKGNSHSISMSVNLGNNPNLDNFLKETNPTDLRGSNYFNQLQKEESVEYNEYNNKNPFTGWALYQ